jgi:2-aminoadipate transaminase
MQWETHFANATRFMKRSAVRELLKVTAQPGMISFAGGLPAADLFPMDEVRAAAEAVLLRHGTKSLQYGETEGLAELRDYIAEQFASSGRRIDRSHIAIVSGAQQALDLIGQVLLDTGDRVLVENPTYLALLAAWRPLGVQFVPGMTDNDGLRIDASFEQLFRRKLKLIYTVCNFQNPSGTTLSAPRRRALVELVAKYSVPVVEDDPYGQLRYEGSSLPGLWELDSHSVTRGHVLYVGTFSKVLMPGLRVGWIVAPPPVIDKLVQAKQAADLHTSTFNQFLVLELLKRSFLPQHLFRLQNEYRTRRDTMLRALATYLPRGCHWTRPEGGMFLMLTLPPGMDGAALLREALSEQVAFVPGEEFHLGDAGRDRVRLNFTNAPPNRIIEGVRRMAQALEKL